MAASTCSTCLRALKGQSRSNLKMGTWYRTASSLRYLTTTAIRSIQLPVPNAGPASSIPSVTPVRAEGALKVTTPTPASMKAASELRKVTGKVTETYTAYGATEALYKECALQADYTITQVTNSDDEMPKTEDGEDLGTGSGWWHTEAGLKPTFSTWSQVTMLHMYLLSVRLRTFPGPSAQPWQQHLLDHFFYDAENRMSVNHNMHARGTRNKYLKDLFVQWRGLLAAYDEGLVKGDAVLAAALWRNIFKANEEVDIKALAEIISYVRKALKGLDALPEEKIGRAFLQFGSPGAERGTVQARSRLMDLPFDKAPGKDLPAEKHS